MRSRIVTEEEMKQLKEGDVVSFIPQKGSVERRTGTIACIGYTNRWPTRLACRMRCVTPTGRSKLTTFFTGERIYSVERQLDPITANVFADWLEENGENRAAAKLRSAFPIHDGNA